MQTNGSDGTGQALSAVNIQPDKRSVCSCTGDEVGVQFYLQLDSAAKPSIGKLRDKLIKAGPDHITWKQGSDRGKVRIPETDRTAIGVFFPVDRAGPTKEITDAAEYVRILNRYLQALKKRLESTVEKLEAEKISHVQAVQVVAYGSFSMA